MLRAISEMAVAMSVCSVVENPRATASSSPICRAVTMSPSLAMTTRMSTATTAPCRKQPVEQLDTLLEIERGCDILERQPELDHRVRDCGLNPDDDGFRSAQLHGVGDAANRPRGERVKNVQGSHVDDHAASAEKADAVGQFLTQLDEVVIGQRRLDRRDQHVPLFQNWDGHDWPRYAG